MEKKNCDGKPTTPDDHTKLLYNSKSNRIRPIMYNPTLPRRPYYSDERAELRRKTGMLSCFYAN